MDRLKLALAISATLWIVGGGATFAEIVASDASATVLNLHSIFVGGFGTLTIVFLLALLVRTLVRKWKSSSASAALRTRSRA
jgi:hypothetical protein